MRTAQYAEKFKKQYQKLPQNLQKKFLKQLKFVLEDFQHPSLRSRKKSGTNVYEARLDEHNRFTYLVEGQEIQFLTIGPHDTGLGEKVTSPFHPPDGKHTPASARG